MRVVQRLPGRRNFFASDRAKLPEGDGAAQLDRVRKRLQQAGAQRDGVGRQVGIRRAPVVEDPVDAEFVPAPELGRDAQREILDVAHPMHGVVAPEKVVVADQGLVPFPGHRPHRPQKIV